MDTPTGLDVERYLRECRGRTLERIQTYLPEQRRHTAGLYDVMLDYPLRPAKALRPALCLASCLALGGNADGALPTAAALELYHNAFLVHDDVEDAALQRRHAPTLHVKYGVPIAVNVGDAMLAVSLEPLLDNTRVLGLGPALRILRECARMARESAEGQMLELRWMRERRWDLGDNEYVRMVHKKTGWYSFITPVRAGAIAAGADDRMVALLGRFALTLGVAFQIHDDLLSLEAPEPTVGKDALGDLWEGKYSLALIHALRSMTPQERKECIAILSLERPSANERQRLEASAECRRLFDKLTHHDAKLDPDERNLLRRQLLGETDGVRDANDVQRLYELVSGRNASSLKYARAVAERFAGRSKRLLESAPIPESVHKAFLRQLVNYVTERSY